jgi:uncharacterized protein
MPTRVNCPNCGRPVDWTPESRFKPFCSERCRLIDLGDWLSESHRIADTESAPGDESAEDELPPAAH